MNIGVIDVLDALKIAIQASKDLQLFYREAAAYLDSDEGKLVFKRLAQREAEHRNQMIKIYSELSGKKILYLNLNKKRKLNMIAANRSNPTELLNIAKQNEKESREFYLNMARSVIDDKIRRMFQEMALEEEQHMAILETSFEKDSSVLGKSSHKMRSVTHVI